MVLTPSPHFPPELMKYLIEVVLGPTILLRFTDHLELRCWISPRPGTSSLPGPLGLWPRCFQQGWNTYIFSPLNTELCPGGWHLPSSQRLSHLPRWVCRWLCMLSAPLEILTNRAPGVQRPVFWFGIRSWPWRHHFSVTLCLTLAKETVCVGALVTLRRRWKKSCDPLQGSHGGRSDGEGDRSSPEADSGTEHWWDDQEETGTSRVCSSLSSKNQTCLEKPLPELSPRVWPHISFLLSPSQQDQPPWLSHLPQEGCHSSSCLFEIQAYY